MKRFSAFVMTVAVLAMLVAAPVYAQQPGTPNDPHHPVTPGTAPGTPPASSTPGPMRPEMPMMDTCRQMMGDMMAMPPAMGGAAPADPRERANMLQMRGEMMKAMGDIMMKHARRMQGAAGK